MFQESRLHVNSSSFVFNTQPIAGDHGVARVATCVGPNTTHWPLVGESRMQSRESRSCRVQRSTCQMPSMGSWQRVCKECWLDGRYHEASCSSPTCSIQKTAARAATSVARRARKVVQAAVPPPDARRRVPRSRPLPRAPAPPKVARVLAASMKTCMLLVFPISPDSSCRCCQLWGRMGMLI